MTESGVEERLHLAGLLKCARAVRASVGRPAPAPGAAAELDLDVCAKALGTTEPIERAIRCADLWTGIAADQLYGLGVLIEDAASVYPLFPVLRSVIEHSAGVVWVLDPQASVRVRAARAALVTLRSEDEACKAASRMESRNSETHNALRRGYRQTQEAVRREFDTLDKVEGKWSVDGATLPSPTKIVKHFGSRW